MSKLRPRIAIIGLGDGGDALAALLAAENELVLFDPRRPKQRGARTGQRLDQAVMRALSRTHGKRCASVPLASKLSAESVMSIVAAVDAVVCLVPRRLRALAHWVNAAALRHGVVATFACTWGESACIGPTLQPGRTACWVCYRIRALAQARAFDQAWQIEQWQDGVRSDHLTSDAASPPLVTASIALLALAVAQRDSPAALAGRVLSLEPALLPPSRIDPVLRRPDCPACATPHAHKAQRRRRAPSARTDLLALERLLVSERTGIIRSVERVARDGSEPALPFVYRAELAPGREAGSEGALLAWGKGATAEAARTGALGEAIERYAGSCRTPAEVVWAGRGALRGRSLDPRELGLDHARTSAELSWIRGRSLIDDAPCWIPAQAAYLSPPRAADGTAVAGANSNGMAAGASRDDALWAGLSEVIERDAFMITWLNRLPCTVVDAATHPDTGIRAMLEAWRRRGVQVRLLAVPTDVPCSVFAAFALLAQPAARAPQLAAVGGFAADVAPAAAAAKALLELGFMRSGALHQLNAEGARERAVLLSRQPERVRSLHDHLLLFSQQRARNRLRFLWSRPGARRPREIDWSLHDTLSARQKLDHVLAHFREQDQEVAYCDLTPSELGELGLCVVRVVVPGFQSVEFGSGALRLATPRVFELPVHLGLRARARAASGLNAFPHPLA